MGITLYVGDSHRGIHGRRRGLGGKNGNAPVPIPQLTDSEIYRFWGNVRVGMMLECWPYMGHCDPYGKFFIKRADIQCQFKASRIAYYASRNEDPGGLFVCHSCDNPPCCNPFHLFLGTRQDNLDDMKSKGRGHVPTGDSHWTRQRPEDVVRGESHPKAKITREIADKIKSEYVKHSKNSNSNSLARKYGIKQSVVYNIIIGKIWNRSNPKS